MYRKLEPDKPTYGPRPSKPERGKAKKAKPKKAAATKGKDG